MGKAPPGVHRPEWLTVHPKKLGDASAITNITQKAKATEKEAKAKVKNVLFFRASYQLALLLYMLSGGSLRAGFSPAFRTAAADVYLRFETCQAPSPRLRKPTLVNTKPAS